MEFVPGTRPDYETWRKANDDPYGRRVMDFIINWADRMEYELAKGRELRNIMRGTYNLEDHDGITGNMYSHVRMGLKKFWVHGEAFAELEKDFWNLPQEECNTSNNFRIATPKSSTLPVSANTVINTRIGRNSESIGESPLLDIQTTQ